MAPRAVILGCGGTDLDPAEQRFLAEADPWGFILFARNVEGPEQVRRLTASLRDTVGRDAPILIDQEGGRVARLKPPAWRGWTAARDECAALPDLASRVQAMTLRYRLIAEELQALGIDVNAAPLLDVLQPGTHPFLVSRLYATDPSEVAAIGLAVAEGLLAGGVLPIIKHIPGHGRAGADSHAELPVVDVPAEALRAVDFAPFRALAHLPLAMTAHVIYPALDLGAPATLSPAIIRIVREEIGFGGLLMTDDLSMGALSGPIEARVHAALAAGCDIILHCNGDPVEAAAVVSATPELAGLAADRAGRALAMRRAPEPAGDLSAELETLRSGGRA